MQNKQSGFSLLEILIVLLMISLFGAFVAPTFMTKKSVAKQKFIAEFATLMQDTLYQAISTKSIHQVYFDFDNNVIIAKEQNSQKQDSNKHKNFSDTFIDKVHISPQFTFHNFYIQATDEVQQGKVLHDAWFYIMPDGTSQAVIMNIEDNSQDPSKQFSITINPFYSQVQADETFQKP